MTHCQECGEHYNEGVRFCRRDGQILDTVSSPAGDETPDPMIGLILAGRYHMLARIGEGGMGVVYQARHITMNRFAAVKVLTSELSRNPEFVARFRREAEMASYLEHPNAVAVYDFGEAENGLVYLAMKFIDGQPLASILKKEGLLPLERVVNIIRQTSAALHAAQRVGLIHRDLKPQNLMVSLRPGQTDWVEVVDFGAAKLTRVDPRFDITRRGFVVGTPDYLSPEQVSGQELDARSDVYSLGLIAYEMVTRAFPFEGLTPPERMTNRLFDSPLPFERVRPGLELPFGVEAVIRKALACDRDQRYSSAVEFALELETEASSKKTRYQSPAAKTSRLVQEQDATLSTAPMTNAAIRALAEPGRPEGGRQSTWRRRTALMAVPALLTVLVLVLLLRSHWPTSHQANEVFAAAGQATEPLATEKRFEEAQVTTPVQRTDEEALAKARNGAPRAGAKKDQDQSSTERVVSSGWHGAAADKGQPPSPDSSDTERGNPRSKKHLARGMEFLRAGSAEKAIKEFMTVQETTPSNQDVHYLMGLAYEQLKRPADALAHYLLCKSGPYAGVSKQHVERLSNSLRRQGLVESRERVAIGV